MTAIPTGPDLANIVANATLNLIAPDPGGLAAGAAVPELFPAAKRKRCALAQMLGGTEDEIERAVMIEHCLDHSQMGAVAAGKNTYN